MSGALCGRTALVTGAASGIGLGITTRLIADGAAVFAATRSKEDLDHVYEYAAVADGFVGELNEPGTADELIAAALGALGHVDVLVNNAGGGVIRPTLEHTEETLRATVDNNLWTTIHCVRAVLPHMVSRRHGRIINIGADSVRTGLMDHAMYNAAKGGVHAMVTGLAREFAATGITANTRTGGATRIRPGTNASGACRRGGHGDRADWSARQSGRGCISGRFSGRRGQPIHHRADDLCQRRQQHGLRRPPSISEGITFDDARHRWISCSRRPFDLSCSNTSPMRPGT
jgi:2,3-dihydroxy-2,3-dihydro-p-cumate dehydrogenase